MQCPLFHSERGVQGTPSGMTKRILRFVHMPGPGAHFKNPLAREFLVFRPNVLSRKCREPAESVKLPDPLFVLLRIRVPVDLVLSAKIRLVRGLTVENVLKREFRRFLRLFSSVTARSHDRFRRAVIEKRVNRRKFPILIGSEKRFLLFQRSFGLFQKRCQRRMREVQKLQNLFETRTDFRLLDHRRSRILGIRGIGGGPGTPKQTSSSG